MNDVNLNFLSSKKEYSVQNEGYLVNKEKKAIEDPFIEDKEIKRNKFFTKVYSYFLEFKSTLDF